MKLFMIYIGGKAHNSFIEVHDIRFVVAEKIEDTYDVLRKEWWGTQDSLHIDAWSEVTHIDDYEVELKDHPCDQKLKLFFVNLGGYDDNQFTELHKNILVVASNSAEAKIKALEHIKSWESPHRDYQYEAENCLCVSDAIKSFIHLTETKHYQALKFVCKYTPIAQNS